MDRISQVLVILLILSMGTYPISWLKLDLENNSLPYYIPIGLILVIVTFFRYSQERKPIRFPIPLQIATWGLITSLAISSLVVSLWPSKITLDQSVASHLLSSEPTTYALIRFLPFILTTLVVIQVIDNPARLKRAYITLMFVSTLLCIYGYFGFFTSSTGDPIEHNLGYFGIRYTQATRNSDALYMTIGLILLGAYLIAYRHNGTKPFQRLSYTMQIVPFVLMGAATVITYSRGAWVSAIVALGYLILVTKNMPLVHKQVSWVRLSIFLLLVIGFGTGLITYAYDTPELLINRVLSFWDFSDSRVSNIDRWNLTSAALLLSVEHPFGLGLGTFWAENAYLNFLVELGILALISFAVLVLFPLRMLIIHTPKTLASNDSWVYLGLTGVIILISVHNLFNVETANMYYWLVYSITASAATIIYYNQREQKI